MNLKLKTGFVLIMLGIAFQVFAYSNPEKKVELQKNPPKALLIELFTNQNLRTHLTNPEWIATLDSDVKAIRERTVFDFNKHFKGRPVFYFIDTNADKIREGHFEGILLDTNLAVATRLSFADNEKNLYIGYFGQYVPQPDPSTVRPNGEGDDPTALRRTFLVMGTNFKLLRLPLPRTYKPKWIVPEFLLPKEEQYMTYDSKHFELGYRPVAKYYNDSFEDFFGENLATTGK